MLAKIETSDWAIGSTNINLLLQNEQNYVSMLLLLLPLPLLLLDPKLKLHPKPKLHPKLIVRLAAFSTLHNQIQQPAAVLPPFAAAAQPQNPHDGNRGVNFNDDAEVVQWLKSESDTQLDNNLNGLFAFAQKNQNKFSVQETAELHWLIQKFHDQVQHRMQCPEGWNP